MSWQLPHTATKVSLPGPSGNSGCCVRAGSDEHSKATAITGTNGCCDMVALCNRGLRARPLCSHEIDRRMAAASRVTMLQLVLVGSAGHERSEAHHNAFDASRAPSASAASYIQTISESTSSRPAKVPKPQSTPAMTFSPPTTRAYCTMRSATSSGCSTKFEVESITPGMMDLAVGQLHVLPHLPFVAVAGVRAAKRQRLRPSFEHDVDDVLQRHVLVVGTLGRGPANVHAHALGRDLSDRVVERLDVGGDHLAEFFEAQMGEYHVAAERQVGTVELQHQAGVHDGAVFARHHVGERVEIGFLARV